MSLMTQAELKMIEESDSWELEMLLRQMCHCTLAKMNQKFVDLEQAMLTELKNRNHLFDY